MKTRARRPRYVICVRNEGCDDLELRKVYEVLADEKTASEGFLRVLDESGEDYLYPADHFLPIDLPVPVKRALALAS